MYVMLAPIEPKPGVDEATLLSASDAFDNDFVRNHPGIVRRHLLRAKSGGYADLVFFENKEVADRLLEAEARRQHLRIHRVHKQSLKGCWSSLSQGGHTVDLVK